MTKFKYFFLNGQKFCTEHQLTISNLTKYFNYNTSLFVLEHNNVICSSRAWDRTFIQDDDKIEIVTIVGGG